MMAALETRARQLAEARAIAVRDTLIVRAGEAAPGVRVSAGDTADGAPAVVLAGRGLRTRLALDPALRWIGGMVP